ncbi:MAG: hypothetical protein SGBAC_009720 [Bacillariaceae sp.]
MKLSKNRAGDNAPMAVIEYVDRPGEIRAARPPAKLQEQIRLQGIEEAMKEMGIAPPEELVGEEELSDIKQELESSKFFLFSMVVDDKTEMNSPTTSWLIPFSLGATSALALVWLSNKASENTAKQPPNVTMKKSDPKKTNLEPSLNDDTATEEEELMDKPDLDHRMLRKAEAVIQWRTTRLVLVIERCTNDHNYSAILRTAEALGIQIVYMIDPPVVDDGEGSESNRIQSGKLVTRTPEEIEARRKHHLFARNATEWLDVRDFTSAEECVVELRKQGYKLWVTDLSQEAECLTRTTPAMPEKVALVMGTEAVGCSQYMLDQADLRVYLPLRGFADSLNLSVATALILHHLFVMDPTLIGGIAEEEKAEIREEWYTKLCQQRLLTSGQKKMRLKLQTQIKRCQAIYDRSQGSGKPLEPQEEKKLKEWDKCKGQLAEIEALLDPAKVKVAVQEWLDNPPKPLTDVRRADSHRICYVGKNTRKFHENHWKDMVATSDATTIHGATANEFRSKVNDTQN